MLASAWLLTMSLLLAPALVDVCSAVCAHHRTVSSSSSPVAAGHAMPAAMRHTHCDAARTGASTSAHTGSSGIVSPAGAAVHAPVARHASTRALVADVDHRGRDGMIRGAATGLALALSQPAHQCQWHARTGAPSESASERTLATRPSSSHDAQDALAAPPATIVIAFASSPSTPPLLAFSPHAVRPAVTGLHAPLRI